MLADGVQCDGNLIDGWTGYGVIDQVHGVVDKQPGWLAFGIPEDFATGG